ncbi:MAG: TCR/Tet family MFS transporter [Bacteroidetes bacterium]|nr:TCR/Tet family MFS transporter [Bacteroidota bacterium]
MLKPDKKPLILIFITLLIDVIGIGIIIPIIPKLLETLGNYSLSEASSIGSWLIFAFAFPQFLLSPFIGSLSDKFGRRPVLLIALVGLGLDYIFHALAPSIALLFVGRIIAGICGASFTTASAYIADISTPEKRSQNFGLIGVAFGLGFILGPVIGGLTSTWGQRAPFWIAACLSLVNALLCYFYLPESLILKNRTNFDWKRANPLGALLHLKKYPLVLKLMVPTLLLYLASHAVQSNWAFYTKYKFNWDEQMIGFSLGVVGVMIAIVQGGLIRIIIPKLGNEKSIFIGFVFYFIGMLLFALANQSWMMFAFTIVYTMGGISGPALQGQMSLSIPANEQGKLSGAIAGIMSISAIIGPLLMNNLFAICTGKNAIIELPGAPMLLGSLLIFIAVISVFVIFRNNK